VTGDGGRPQREALAEAKKALLGKRAWILAKVVSGTEQTTWTDGLHGKLGKG